MAPRFALFPLCICAKPLKPLGHQRSNVDSLITPTLKAAGSNPVGRTKMNTTRISNFFVETRVVTYSESLILQGFPLFYVQPMHIRKHQNFKDVFIRQHDYMNTVFRYSYLDMLLQTLAVFCISAFDGGELHCKNGYIHPHSFESAAQKYIHAGRPPLF